MHCWARVITTVVLSSALFLLLCLAGCRSKTYVSAPNTHPVKSTKGYTIDIPNGWDETQMATSPIDHEFSRPIADGPQNFIENVNIVVESLPQPMTVDEYYQANLPMMKTILPNFTEVSTAPFTENVTWKKVVYTWQTATGRALKVTSYYFIKGMKAYIITATATPTTSAQYETKFDEIARSFRWNKN